MAVLSKQTRNSYSKQTRNWLVELFNPETAFSEPVNVRTEGWTPRAEFCLLYLRNKGVSPQEIAERLDCSRKAVYSKHAYLLHRMGLSKPQRVAKAPKQVRVGVGNRRSPDDSTVRMLIGFDEETFNEIRERAVQNNTAFAAEVRLLVEFGLDTVKMAAD
jgi:hypothetical protein